MIKTYLILSEINNTQIIRDMIFICQNIVRWSVEEENYYE